MKKLYESAIAEMTSLLENTVDGFSRGYEVYGMKSLFCVSNEKFPLMVNTARMSNYQVLKGCRQLCIDMCSHMNLNVKVTQDVKDIDFIIEKDDELIGVLISFFENFMTDVPEKEMNSLSEMLIVVLQEPTGEHPVFYPPGHQTDRNYKYKKLVKQITIKQFFEMLGREDYEDFRECVGRYNYDAEQMLGITISAIPTKKAMEKHREKIKKELLSYFYENELKSVFDDKEISNMKKYFETYYGVLVSNTDFSQSLLSSEWYYDLQVMTEEGIEQTAIVAGYLKSLEQLLCDVLLVLSEDDNNEFMFFTNKEGKAQTGQERLPLNKSNQKLVLTMGKNILKVIKGNKKDVLRKTKMTDRVIEYLEEYIEKTRNGYMHKDNLYEWDEIQNIRAKTYAAYFMILGTFYIDEEKLLHVND